MLIAENMSLMDKFKKADIALNYGVDLVVELPFKYIQSADFFAKGAVEILNKLGCDTIVFGSESNNIGVFVFLHDYECFAYFNNKVNIPTNDDKTLVTHLNGNLTIDGGCKQVQEIFKTIRGHVDTNIQILTCYEYNDLEYFLDELPKAEDWKYAKNLSEFLNDELGTDTTPDDFYEN